MRVKLIATIVVLAVSLAICLFSQILASRVLGRMEDMTVEMLEHASEGDVGGARETLAQMAEHFQNQRGLLEALTPHEDLHDITIQYTLATSNLEAGDLTDFQRSVVMLQESIKHLRDHEALSLSNLF